ncbi:MAG: anion transporter [Anaerolineales bacterium]
MLNLFSLATLLLIIMTLIGVAVGRYPWLRMNRATIALVGAIGLILLGAISLEQAYDAIDMNTIVLLFAMMVLNVNLRISGFFQIAVQQVVQRANSPRKLLFLIILSSGILSALLLNDTIVLMFTPLVLDIAESLKRNPIPYLIGLVTAANIGSVAAITGNPQNMIIGIASRIPFVTFSAYLLPVSLFGLFIAWLFLVLLYPAEFVRQTFQEIPVLHLRTYQPLLRKTLIAIALMILGFILGAPIPLAALSAAAFLLITRRLKPQRVFLELDWALLVFFSGLFIVTGAIQTSGLAEGLFAVASPIAGQGVAALSLVSAVLSNLVSNVPAVLLFRPIISGFAIPEQAWLTLSMSTTFAGNLTLLGSVANLIVAEIARQRGVRLTFMEYLKPGLVITLTTLFFGILWLSFIFNLAL